MDYVTLLGLTAGTLTTISFLPQVIKTWRSKSVKDISIGMFLTYCIGILLWIFYGIYINSVPVIFTNIVTFTLAFLILVMKMRYKWVPSYCVIVILTDRIIYNVRCSPILLIYLIDSERGNHGDFCEIGCPICVPAREGNKVAKFFQNIEMAITFGGCWWGMGDFLCSI